MRYFAYAVMRLKILSAFLCVGWITNDLPLLIAYDDPIVLLPLVINAFWALLPWGVGTVVSFTANSLFVELRCSHCKDSFRRHEKPSGEVHACKGWHFDIRHFRLTRWGCPAFIASKSL
ncbi:hypothetical protein NTE_00700 [Candidatus Nitrososphaera evergladensis SR1]|uniref:Uncharacterized protein n=1 Tax=Candidatus Nitrososphaera evergladensis SR1 TaxID=1459636 RepID=A0A075MNS2_9ARCH|nr:hypothetical protein [Candidatus Nitrososphaera evergladensis]AIF82780.1 hypothetical protein NTE_00700 [Candidatus Nitrososphaera evergladensis SR1]